MLEFLIISKMKLHTTHSVFHTKKRNRKLRVNVAQTDIQTITHFRFDTKTLCINHFHGCKLATTYPGCLSLHALRFPSRTTVTDKIRTCSYKRYLVLLMTRTGFKRFWNMSDLRPREGKLSFWTWMLWNLFYSRPDASRLLSFSQATYSETLSGDVWSSEQCTFTCTTNQYLEYTSNTQGRTPK